MYISRAVTVVNVLGDIIIAGIVNDWSREELRKIDQESRQYSRATSRISTRRNNAAAVNM